MTQKFYRNIIPIEDIEERTLWILKEENLILFDDDIYITLPADIFLKHFYAVDCPVDLD